MVFALAACGGEKAPAEEPAEAPAEAPAEDAPAEDAPAEDAKVYNVAYLVNGNLGDKSFFDSANSGLQALKEAGRIELTTIEMGGLAEDQPKWLETLYEVSDDGSYDVIVCGTYQMPDYLKEVATA